MTLQQIIYNLRNLIKDAKSDDVKISDRQFEYLINYVRSRLIKQEIDKGKSISENIKQDLGQIQVAPVDSTELTGVTIGQTLYKTLNKLPSFIELNYKDGVVYVGGMDRVTPFQFTTKAYANWSRYSKYASREKHTFLRDNYMYVLVNPPTTLKYINIQGVFEDPRAAWEFANPTQVYDSNINTYPISSWMIETLNELIVTKDLNMFFQLPQDTKNDAASNSGKPEIKSQEMIRQNGGYGS